MSAIAVRPLSITEAKRLASTLPELRAKEAQLRQRAAALGIGYEIPAYGGVRTEADQAQLERWRDDAVKLKGASAWYPVAPFGKSMHEVGAAFDVKVTTTPPGMNKDQAYHKLGALGELIGLEWGGRWKKSDPFHFELTGARASYVVPFAAASKLAGGADLAQLTAAEAAQLGGVLKAGALALLALAIVRVS